MKLLRLLLAVGYGWASENKLASLGEAHGTMVQFMIDEILRNKIGSIMMKPLNKLCDPCRKDKPEFYEIVRAIPIPTFTLDEDVGIEERIDTMVGAICEAVNCYDKAEGCPEKASDGKCSTQPDWMNEYCRNSCGCKAHVCEDDDELDPLQMAELVEYEDAYDEEHSDTTLTIHEAIQSLDPTSVLSQFQPEIRKTLQTQICSVPDPDVRITQANNLLAELTEGAMAKKLRTIQEKIQLYLDAVPTTFKELIANEVICAGYKREIAKENCLDRKIGSEDMYCRARISRFTYCQKEGACIPVDYDGCFQTENRFRTKQDCESQCAVFISAKREIEMKRLAAFTNSLNTENLRVQMLQLFGRVESNESTESLIDLACDKNSKIKAQFRDTLCTRLRTLHPKDVTPKPTSNPISPTIGPNPLVISTEMCVAENAVNRISCPGLTKPRRNFKSACQAAGCCWDQTPPAIKGGAKWRHYCFSKTVKMIKTNAEQVAKVVENDTDAEHSDAEARDSKSLKCDVTPDSRERCAAKRRFRSQSHRQNYCQNQGCCFDARQNNWAKMCYNSA